ncbi:MAG TPA: beta-propeller fold lactonase family protein [Nannocystaceae bacterium]|nr:beta-propeller fold lactonase family protein [Nannocystaceae bacterium]
MRAHGLAIATMIACNASPGGDAGTSTSASTTGASDTTSTDGTSTSSTSSSSASGSSSGSTGVDETSAAESSESSTGALVPGPAIVYVASGTQIHRWRMDPDDGALADHDGLELGADVGPLAHAGDRLWVGVWGNDAIGTFAIDPTSGALTELDQVDVGGMVVYLAIDRTTAHVLAADFNRNEVSSWPLDGDGVAHGPAATKLDVGTNPHSIVLAPAGDFAFAPHLTSNEIRQLVYDEADGTLAFNDPDRVTVSNGTGPRHMIFAEDARFAWVINETGDSITRWIYDARAGLLSQPDTVSTLPRGTNGSNNYCADLHLGQDEAFLYGSNRGEDTLAMFAVDPRDGTLTLLDQFDTEAHPRSFAIDPTRKFLYAAGRDSGRLASYAIAGDGSLAPQDTIDAMPEPGWVEIVPLPR